MRFRLGKYAVLAKTFKVVDYQVSDLVYVVQLVGIQ